MIASSSSPPQSQAPAPVQPPIFPSLSYQTLLPPSLQDLPDLQTEIPKIAKNSLQIQSIEQIIQNLPSQHFLYNLDSRNLSFIADQSVHLVLTSPPYWILKQYHEHPGQLGSISCYQTFLLELEKVWRHCYRVLVPGGRLICVVGDICLSRRKNNGRHTVVPLHSSIQEQCRHIGYDNLAPILWYKISNVQHEAQGNGTGFLGKPYEPNGVIKNDIEYILMERKHGGYRKPSLDKRLLSVISAENHQQWFQSIWSGLTGASTRNHPAPYPEELAVRLIRMFSFVGDTVLDPFLGTGTTSVAAAKWGRHSIGVELDPIYYGQAEQRMRTDTTSLFSTVTIHAHPARAQ